MEDLTGLGKVAESVAKLGDSQLPNKAYDDLLAAPMREGGKGLTDLVKAFRLFLAPIQLLAVAQDRLAAFCERVRAKVPEDRQQEASPSIALPVLMDLRFMEDDNPLTELYLNLLARAIDKERCSEAHPAFVKIIEQMSPDEAMVMCVLQKVPIHLYSDWSGVVELPLVVWDAQTNSLTDFPVDRLLFREGLDMYISHLAALNLVVESLIGKSPEGYIATGLRSFRTVEPTHFGRWFIQACIPESFASGSVLDTGSA